MKHFAALKNDQISPEVKFDRISSNLVWQGRWFWSKTFNLEMSFEIQELSSLFAEFDNEGTQTSPRSEGTNEL